MITLDTLLEIAKIPYEYSRNHETELLIRKVYRSAEVYDLEGTSNSVLLFKRNGFWEVHVSNETGITALYSVAGRLLASINELIFKKLDEKLSSFLIYGPNEKLTNTWVRLAQKMNKNVIVRNNDPIEGVDGIMYPNSYVLTLDRRSFRLEEFIKKFDL